MAVIKSKAGLDKIITSEANLLLNSITKDIKSRRVLNKVGKEARDQIVKRTRLGKGVSGGGQIRPLKKLKRSTKEYRKFYQKNLSSLTNPNRSNLTATGQFLDALIYKVNPVNGKIELFFKENRRRELSGGPARAKHNDILEFVSKDRFFFDLASFEIRKLESIIFLESRK